MNFIFKERQKLTQFWLWLIMTGLAFITFHGIYKQLFLKESFGNNPLPDWGLIIFTLFVFSLIALFAIIRLDMAINKNEIQIHFFPFIKRHLNWKDIESAEVMKYGCLGGWGIRFSTKYGQFTT